MFTHPNNLKIVFGFLANTATGLLYPLYNEYHKEDNVPSFEFNNQLYALQPCSNLRLS